MDKNEKLEFISMWALFTTILIFLAYAVITQPKQDSVLEGGNIQRAIDTKQY
jgi:hypothetical protein